MKGVTFWKAGVTTCFEMSSDRSVGHPKCFVTLGVHFPSGVEFFLSPSQMFAWMGRVSGSDRVGFRQHRDRVCVGSGQLPMPELVQTGRGSQWLGMHASNFQTVRSGCHPIGNNVRGHLSPFQTVVTFVWNGQSQHLQLVVPFT